jgi:hypothetical protein
MPSITDFKQQFNGGTRANRFYVEGSIPSFNSIAGNISSTPAFTNFHIRSTQIPQLSTKTLSYDFFGRKYHYPGEKDYGTWSFVVLDDYTNGDGNLWKKFHSWQDAINNHDSNYSFQARTSGTNNTGAGVQQDSAKYKANNWRIQHLNLNGEDSTQNPYLKTFVMHGCWPTSVQPISFNMGNPNSLNSFVVIMVYDYIELLANDSYITNRQ